MSTRNDQDEPLATRGKHTPPEVFPARVDTANVSPGTSTSYTAALDGKSEDGRQEREISVARAGLLERLQNFIGETRDEMHRVSWPTATEVKNTTIITIVAVIFFAAYLFVVDRSFTFLIEGLTNLLSRLV